MKIAKVWAMLLVPAVILGAYAIIVVALWALDSTFNVATPPVSANLKSPAFHRALAEIPAARRPTKIEFDSAVFEHTSHWERVENRRDGRYHGSSLRSFYGGALARVAFTGAGIRLYGIVGQGGGVGVVSIDGHAATNANFYAPQKATHRRVFESASLVPGRHVMVVEVALSAASRDHRRFVNIDGIEVDR